MRPSRSGGIVLAALIAATPAGQAQVAAPVARGQEIRLWPGKAPGSEQWTIPETVTPAPEGGRSIANVSDPTISVYLPEPAAASGTAVIIAPGGALRFLAWDEAVARWLNSKGIAAFLLKYRTLQIPPSAGRGGGQVPLGLGGPLGSRQEIEIRNANANPAPNDAALTEVLHMGIADAEQALWVVRRRASEWRIDPSRVGMMGFSAGGGVIVGTAMQAARSDAYPDFLLSLYGPSLMDVTLPPHAPPLFIAVGATHFNVTSGCLALFSAWKAAGKPVELHVYDQVSAGFGMAKRGLPVDGWTDRAYEWLVARKLTR